MPGAEYQVSWHSCPIAFFYVVKMYDKDTKQGNYSKDWDGSTVRAWLRLGLVAGNGV